MFIVQLQQLTIGLPWQIIELNNRQALLRISVNGNLSRKIVYIIPYDGMWEFSVQSAISVYNLGEFSHELLTKLLMMNGKRKRAMWCIEYMGGKYVLSAMLNISPDILTSVEFFRVCNGLITEVEKLEMAILGNR